MIERDQVLNLIREKGPLIPRDIVKVMGADTFIVGAVLSTLVDSKTLRLSSAKIGGSPVYYLPGQEEKLDILYPYLNEKDRRAFDLLKERKVFRDVDGDPLLRVSLRTIKDFAKPLEVAAGDAREIFWRWHMVSNQEAETLIREMLGQTRSEKVKPQPALQQVKLPEPKETEESPVRETAKVIPPEPQKIKETDVEDQIPIKPAARPTAQEKPAEHEHQKTLEPDITDDLLSRVKKIFLGKNIEMHDVNVIRKNSDIEMVLVIPSAVGKLKYFCKVRDKKKTNDKDLSSLFVDSQVRKLPALYVTTGELTKKAEEKLEHDFRLITVMRI
jgi:hypothetical protein